MATPSFEYHFEHGDYKGPVDFYGYTDCKALLALLSASRDRDHLGSIQLRVTPGPTDVSVIFPLIAPDLELTINVDKLSRKLCQDNVAEKLDPSWYRDNNYSDVVRGAGRLALPSDALIEPGVMQTADGTGFIDPQANFLANIPYHGAGDVLVNVQLPLFTKK